VSSVTAAQLEGDAEMSACNPNPSGTFVGHIVPDYLGSADPGNADGAYGWAYAPGGGYPVLAWQLMPDFSVDPAGGGSAPATSYSVAAAVVGGHGTVTVDPPSVTAGGACAVTLVPDAGYWPASVTDNGTDVRSSVVGSVYTITGVTSDHTVVVTYSNGTHALTYAAGAHGRIDGASLQTVTDGADGSPVTAEPDEGYHFAAWTDGSTEDPRTDTGVTADLTVKALFLPDDTVVRPWDHFTIAVLPDTQYYSEGHPSIFEQQTQWIADHAEADNIVFVAHLGDLVEAWSSTAQWRTAHDAMAIVRAAGIPYSVVPGNHDIGYVNHDVSSFDASFPYTDFTGFSWYGGHHPTTSNASSYELFSAMGQRFLVLNLVCDPALLADATDWANAVLSSYPDRKVIVVTHGYVDTSGAFVSGSSVAGAAVWDDVVKLHSNVVAVLCGHVSGEYEGTSTGVAGNTVYNLLTDYQDEPDGGDGWLRLYEFYPLEDKVRAVTYSPYLDQYQTDVDSRFELGLEQDSHAVTFVSRGATYARMVAASGSQIAAPAAPERSGYDFSGWYADQELTTGVSFPYTVHADTTLYAGWTSIAPIRVVRPCAGAAWPRGSTRIVRWTADGSLGGRRFTVKLSDAAGRTRLAKTVKTRSGVTGHATRLRLPAAIRNGIYRVEVSTGPISSRSPRFRVVPARPLRVTAPAAQVRWRRRAGRTVAWTLCRRLTHGSFGLYLRSAAGATYTLRSAFVPAAWTGRYAARVRLPRGVPAGAGYRLLVRWRGGASALVGRGPVVVVAK
jgi:uncharacterized repeat protein (TIGR02543 family)